MECKSLLILFHCIILCVFELSTAQEYYKMAWVEKPPYTTKRPATQNRFNGILYDVLKTKLHFCGYFESVRVKYENDIVKKLHNGEALLGGPIVVKGRDPVMYQTLPFIAILDYPGADFITKAEPKEFAKVITMTILGSWPLLALTLILTAVSGIITWALDTVINPQEFPRSFLRGSWEGFWWSFISMTTVGYGDKSPKSFPSRIFAMIWIQVGLVIMAIFMAVITSALTSVSLEPDTKSIHGSTVAVLGNGTEYQLALKSGAKPKVFDTFTKMMKAFDSDEVTGILVDRISGYYYLTQDGQSNRSIVTSEQIPLTASLGLAVTSQEKYRNTTECLTYMKNFIRQEILAIISTYKAPQQKAPKSVKLFDLGEGSLLRVVLFIALGTLVAMVMAGVTWDITRHKDGRTNIRNTTEGNETKETREMITKQNSAEELRRDLDQGKRMLRQLHEYFELLEQKSLERVY